MRATSAPRAGRSPRRRALREQVVGVHRAGGGGPRRRRAVAGDRGTGAAPCREEVGDRRPDDERPVAEVGVERGGEGHRVVDAAADADDPRAVDRHEQLDTRPPGGPVEVGEHRRGSTRGRRPDHDDDPGHGSPAERGGPRLHRLVGLTADDRIDDQRLEAGVPGTPGLGRLGVDLGRGERDLPAVAEHGLAGEVALTGSREVGDLALDDRDDRADEVERLGEGDRARQLAGCGAEDVRRDLGAILGAAEPVEERGDARLGDQARPRTGSPPTASGTTRGRSPSAGPRRRRGHLRHGRPGCGWRPTASGGRTAYRECICMPLHNPALPGLSLTAPGSSAPQSVPDSIAARSRASSPPSTSGFAVIWSYPPAGSSPKRVPFSTSSWPCSTGWPA